MRSKIFLAITVFFPLLLGALLFLSLRKPPALPLAEQGYRFKNRYATLKLEENSKISPKWQAYLRVTTPQCNGSLAQKGVKAAPAEAFFKTGDFSDGILSIYQPPTMGEAACGIDLFFKQHKITKSIQTQGDCQAWHGKACGFTTEILGGMESLPPPSSLDKARLTS